MICDTAQSTRSLCRIGFRSISVPALCSGIAPDYDKTINDTVPILFVKPEKDGKRGVSDVEKALVDAYVKKGIAKDTALPSQCIIVDTIPYNENGKISIYSITQGKVPSERYDIKGIRRNGKIVDIELKKSLSDSALNTAQADELGSNLNIGKLLDFFLAEPAAPKGRHRKGKEDDPMEILPELLAFLKENGVIKDHGNSGMPFDMFFRMMKDMRDRYDDEDNNDSGEESQEDSPFSGPVGDILRVLFRASSYDKYCED